MIEEKRRSRKRRQNKMIWGRMKRCFTAMLAVMVLLASIPLEPVWADNPFEYEYCGDDDIILADSVEEGEYEDIDVDISHTISENGEKATVIVSATPSVYGEENGVLKVTRVELHEDGKTKQGKQVDGNWQFTVKDNGIYSFLIHYSTVEGDEMTEATPSEAETMEPGGETGTEEAETMEPGGETGTEEAESDAERELAAEETLPEASGEKTDDAISPSGDSEPLVLRFVDFLLPVIEAEAGVRKVKKAIIVSYEIDDLFREGNPEDVDLQYEEELTDEGAVITVTAVLSETGREQGASEITSIDITGFEPAKEWEPANPSEATPSIATPSEASVRNGTDIRLNGVEYQEPEADGEEYRFFVKQNGTYTFSVVYDSLRDTDTGDSGELEEKQFQDVYELGIIQNKITFTGVEDIRITVGEKLDLLEGVGAVDTYGNELEDVVILDDGGFDVKKPGEYQVTYGASGYGVMPLSPDGDAGHIQTAERTIRVMEREGTRLELQSRGGVFQKDGGTLAENSGTETLSVSYTPIPGETGQYLELTFPSDIMIREIPGLDSVITGTEPGDINTANSRKKIAFKLADGITETVSFEIVVSYNVYYNKEVAKTWIYTTDDGKMEGPIRLEARSGDGSSLIEACELAAMTYKRPFVDSPLVLTVGNASWLPPWGHNESNQLNMQLYRNGRRKSGGYYHVADGAYSHREISMPQSHVDSVAAFEYIKIYKIGQTDAGRICLAAGGGRDVKLLMGEDGSDEKGAYIYYDLTGQKEKIGSRLSYYRVYDTIGEEDDYLRSETPYDNRVKIVVGYYEQGKLIEYDAPIIEEKAKVEKWRNLDTEIAFEDTPAWGADGKDDIAKHIMIGTSQYEDKDQDKFLDKYLYIPRVDFKLVLPDTDSGFTNYITPIKAKVKATIELPYEVDIDLARMNNSIRTMQAMVTYTNGHTAIFHIDNSGTLQGNFEKPDGERVRKIELSYEAEYTEAKEIKVWSLLEDSKFICGETHEDGTAIQDGDRLEPILYQCDISYVEGNEKKEVTYRNEFELIAKEKAKSPVSVVAELASEENELSYTDTSYVAKKHWVNGQRAHYSLVTKGKNEELEPKDWENPQITLNKREGIGQYPTEEELLTLLTGEMTVSAALNGWDIDYATEMNGNQTYQISGITDGSWKEIKLLEDGDRFTGTEIVLKGRGKISPPEYGTPIIKDLIIEIPFPNNKNKSLFGPDLSTNGTNNGGALGVGLESTTASGTEQYKEKGFYRTYYSHVLARWSEILYSPSSNGTVYQGQEVTSSVVSSLVSSLYGNYSVNSSKNNFFEKRIAGIDRMSSYIKVTDTDVLHYVKGSLSVKDSPQAVIEEISSIGNETWLKVSGANRVDKMYNQLDIKFFADPAAPVGTIADDQRPKVAVYRSIEELKSENALEINQIINDFDRLTLVPCPVDTNQKNQYITHEMAVGPTEMLLRTDAGAQMLLGVGGSYSQTTIGFQAHQKDLMTTLLSFSASKGRIYDVEMLVNIPKKGETVTYQDGTETKTIKSEYDMFLGGAVKEEVQLSDATVEYEYEVNGNWEKNPVEYTQVTRIKITVSQIPGEKSISFRIPLVSEDKDTEGTLNSYLSAAYRYSNSQGQEATKDYTYGTLKTFQYQDYTIGGVVWEDSDEDGKLGDASKEERIEGLEVGLYRNRDNTLIKKTETDANGEYQFTTWHSEGLKVKIELPDGEVFTKYQANGALNPGGSEFIRDIGNSDYSYAKLPDDITRDYEHINAGIVTLPILTVNDVRVEHGKTKEVEASATVPPSAPEAILIYESPDDGSVATLENRQGKYFIHGLKENGKTKATVRAKNSLGDEVVKEYQISVSNIPVPVIKTHDWTVIEGDGIPDLWEGITVEDPAPEWKKILLGVVGKRNRSIDEDSKEYAVYNHDNLTKEIELSAALEKAGLYTIKYTVKNDRNETADAYATLTVHGKLTKSGDIFKRYFETGEQINVPTGTFSYIHVDEQGQMESRTVTSGIESVPETWTLTLKEGQTLKSVQTAEHPRNGDVTKTWVTAGSGRTAEITVEGVVDSKVEIKNFRSEYVALQGESVEVEWSSPDAVYRKSDRDGNYTETEAQVREIRESGSPIGTDSVVVDTSEPTVKTYEKYAQARETYENQDADGNQRLNATSVVEMIRVIGKPKVTSEPLYVSPEQAKDETIVKKRLVVSAVYHDGIKEKEVPVNNLSVRTFNRNEDNEITSVDVWTYAENENNRSDYRVPVTIRPVPVLDAPGIHLRIGDQFTVDDKKPLIPADAHNSYTITENTVDTKESGTYQVVYRTHDNLTGDGTDITEAVYVHKKPEILAPDEITMLTNETGDEAAVVEAIKGKTSAKAEFADGTPTVEVPGEGEGFRYQVSDDFRPGTVGEYKVQISFRDNSIQRPAGLHPAEATKEVTVRVIGHQLNVTFTPNNDSSHARGLLDGKSGPVIKETIYGEAAVLPQPSPNAGYEFRGYKTTADMTATVELLVQGTTIIAGGQIPSGTLLTEEQVETILLYQDTEFVAYFSATPVIKGTNIKIYEGETYHTSDFDIQVSDLDGDAGLPSYDVDHVNPDEAGTYQVKVTVSDNDGNQAETNVYVQVYGKTKLKIGPAMNIRVNDPLEGADIKNSVKAVYKMPPEVPDPDQPWSESDKINGGLAVSEEEVEIRIESDLAAAAAVIGRKEIEITADGQITGHEEAGAASDRYRVYVHGKPAIRAAGQTLFTHLSANEDVLIQLIKDSAQAETIYINEDGTQNTVKTQKDGLSYELKAEEGYMSYQAGTYQVTISFSDKDSMPSLAGLAEAKAEAVAVVTVADKVYQVEFSTNSDEEHVKGSFDKNTHTDSFRTTAVHGDSMAAIPSAVAYDGYRLKGFKALSGVMVAEKFVLADGTIIQAGDRIGAETMLTAEEIARIKFASAAQFQAYFISLPVITGDNIQLYQGEQYSRSALNIEVKDEDGKSYLLDYDDKHVDQNQAGTYQVKVSVSSAQDQIRDEIYVYVQVFGKTRFASIPDLHIRKGDPEAEAAEGVRAVYEKPGDIPLTGHWPDAKKTNQETSEPEVAVLAAEAMDTGRVGKAEILLEAPGMIPGRGEDGKGTRRRAVYIHGTPVVVAYDNSTDTHRSTSADVLGKIVETGRGNVTQAAASAYVEYVDMNGDIYKVTIPSGEITYSAESYEPLTPGDYYVTARVDDSGILSNNQIAGLKPVTGERQVKVAVADKTYTVRYELDDQGAFAHPADASTQVIHGRTATPPELVMEEGYTLDSWRDETGKKVDLSTLAVTSDRVFRAGFKLKEFRVRFIGRNNRVIKTETVVYGQDAAPPTDHKDVQSKLFEGWNKDYRNIKADVDIYAKYAPRKSPGSGAGGPGMKVPDETEAVPEATEVPKPDRESQEAASSLPERPVSPDSPAVETSPDSGSQDIPIGKVEVPAEAPKSGDAILTAPATSSHAENRHRCLIHYLLLLLAGVEGIYYYFKRKRDKEFIEQLKNPGTADADSDCDL